MINSGNKRDHHRMSIETEAEYRSANGSGYTNCMVYDLSASGMLLMTADAVNEGAVLNVRITPNHPITPPLDAEIEAIRCSEKEDGRFEVACKIVEVH